MKQFELVGMLLTISVSLFASLASAKLGEGSTSLSTDSNFLAKPNKQEAANGCPESLPVDLYMKCLERKGILPRRVGENKVTRRQLADATYCDSTASDSALEACANSYFKNNVHAEAQINCGAYVNEQQVLNCIRGLPVETSEATPARDPLKPVHSVR